MIRIPQHQRDERDLRILQLLDEGLSQDQAAKAMGMSRGPIARMIADIRRDEAAQ